MKYIDHFFAVREEINEALRNEDLDLIREKFPEWIWQQCMNYSQMTGEERKLSEDIPVLDQQLKMRFCWPEKFEESRQPKGVISVVTHELSRTGAPLVLLDAVRIMRENGYFVILFSPEDGALKDAFLQAGVPVIIGEYLRWLDKTTENQECFRFWKRLEAMVCGMDLLFCNTVVTYQVIKKFLGQAMPVFWWIHESQAVLDQVKRYLPVSLTDNIRTAFVSDYSRKAFEDCGFFYKNSSIMSYGIDDIKGKEIQTDGEKIKFVTVGTISERKGQDILLKAIDKLDEEIREKCQFLFVGKKLDAQVYELIYKAAQKNTWIEYKSEVDHETMERIIQASDCLICPSRDDAMPVVATESFALRKVVICSDHTGTAKYIRNGQNGFVFRNEDGNELKEIIGTVCAFNQEKRNRIGENARKIFEDHFTIQIFEDRITGNIEDHIQKKVHDFRQTRQTADHFSASQQKRLLQLNQWYQELEKDMREQGDAAYKDSMYLHGIVENLEAEKKLLEEKVSDLEKEERRQKEELNNIYDSLSWKMLSPLRKAMEKSNGKKS